MDFCVAQFDKHAAMTKCRQQIFSVKPFKLTCHEKNEKQLNQESAWRQGLKSAIPPTHNLPVSMFFQWNSVLGLQYSILIHVFLSIRNWHSQSHDMP